MEYFSYQPEYRTLGCRVCKTFVIGHRINTHLRASPHKLKGQQIKQAEQWASRLDIIQGQDELDALPTPLDDIRPIAALGEPNTGGFRCTFISDCKTVGSSLKRIREHLRVIHGWNQHLQGGRRTAGETAEERSGPWRSDVIYQRFFVKGPRSEYFEVARGQTIGDTRAADRDREVDIQRAVDAFQAKAMRLRREEASRIDEQSDFGPPNSWLRRLGAASHLKDFSNEKAFLRGLISMEYNIDSDQPQHSDDDALRHIHSAFDSLVMEAKLILRPEIISWNALFEVNRKELKKERSKPFHFRLKPETQKRYALQWKQVLAYVVRAMALGDPSKRPPFKLSRRQKDAFETLMGNVRRLAGVWTDECDPEEAGFASLLSTIKTNVLELAISTLDHFTKATEYDSVLVSFLMVLSVRADDQWESYGNFTPKLSGIMSVARLLLVKYAVDQRWASIQRKMDRGHSREAAEEDSPSYFDLISRMVRRFMAGGGEGWQTTPVQFIVRLRNYGVAATNSEATPGSVSWNKEEALFKGIRISVPVVQAMIQGALRLAESKLYEGLLFYSGYEEETPAELGLPEIPWDTLLDNAADATIGHSFVERLYELDEGASKGWVFRKVWGSEELNGAWVEPGPGPEDGFKLNEREVTRYGLAVEEMLKLLLFLTHISSGQPARGPEILTVQHRNTANGGIRNVLIDRGLVMIVTGYHKGFSRTERLKVIHRFLPREIGILVTYYLWLVLPFWEDVQANAWDKAQLSTAIWATEESLNHAEGQENSGGAHIPAWSDDDDEDVGEGGGGGGVQGRRGRGRTRQHRGVVDPRKLGSGDHWTSARMTRILRRLSIAGGCEGGLTISSWRHVAIAFARKYFRDATTAQRTFDEMDAGSDSDSDGEDDSPWDIQAGHGSMQAGLIYGRLITEASFETNERRSNFRQISEEWHRLLGFASAIEGIETYNGKALINSSRVDLINPCMTHYAGGRVDLGDWG